MPTSLRESTDWVQDAAVWESNTPHPVRPATVPIRVQPAVSEVPAGDQIVGSGPAIQNVLKQLRLVAATDSTVVLLGETGTGKELFASYIHELSVRRSRPMVRVNCAAIPDTLIESELFGREKGAFT